MNTVSEILKKRSRSLLRCTAMLNTTSHEPRYGSPIGSVVEFGTVN